MEQGKKKLAVLVGCNYQNTANELHGCINDVIDMRQTLIKRFGFSPSHIQLLTDNDQGSGKALPTGANIKKVLGEMIDQAKEGDILYFHFSGHGTRIPSLSPVIHPHRKDDAIVPCDFNLITDMDFRELVNRVPKGARLTILSDSCFSGGLIDKEKEQIGPSSYTPRSVATPEPSQHFETKPKTIPFESILSHLSSLTTLETSNIGPHLMELFGEHASVSFRSPSPDSWERDADGGILLSGCQSNEVSADIRVAVGGGGGGGGKKAYGAFSNAVETVIGQERRDLTNKEVVVMARKLLQEQELQQHPCLYCADAYVEEKFLI